MKINRHISILIAMLILVSNVGLAFNVHYCHGKVSSVTLTYRLDEPCDVNKEKEEDASSCCSAKIDNHKKCCKNDIVKLKDKSDNIIVKSQQLDFAAFYTVNEWKSVQPSCEVPFAVKEIPSFYCEANAPPLFKLYCQYIFYA
jgi:hypothetical protein